MDPLSIAASVSGLLTVAGKVASVLFKVSSGIGDAPQSMNRLISLTKELEVIFTAVNDFISSIGSVSRSRLSMIQVEPLVATLTEAVLTFSELEALANRFGMYALMTMPKRMVFIWKEDAIASIILRLDRHKSSLSLILNIIQCESNIEAEQSQKRLFDLVQQLLESNHDISRRLQSLENMFDAESIQTIRLRNRASVELVETDSQAGGTNPRQSSSLYSLDSGCYGRRSFQPSFQIDLEASRVYARTQLYHSDVSFTTSINRTHAWSIFSMISLSQVSCISAIALPVYSDEISNTERYQFGIPEHNEVAGRFTVPRTPSPERLSTDMDRLKTKKLMDSDSPTSQTSQAAVGTMYTSELSSSRPAQGVRRMEL